MPARKSKASNPNRKPYHNDLNQVLLSGRVSLPPEFNPAFPKKNGTTAPFISFRFANQPFASQSNFFVCEAWGVVAQKLHDLDVQVGHGLWISGTISSRTLNIDDSKFVANFIYVAKFAVVSRPGAPMYDTTHTETPFVQDGDFEELFPPSGAND